jgi:hypothetical protein
VDEEEEPAVREEEEVDDDEQVVRVPEGVEPGEPVQQRGPAAAGLMSRRRPSAGGALLPLPERARGQGEGDGHESHHHDARHALRAGEEAPVRRLGRTEEAGEQAVVLVGARRDQAREVARQMAPGVQADAQRDRHRDDLQNTNKRKKNQQQLRKIMQMQTGRWVGAQEILSAKLVTSQAHRHYDCHCTSGPAKALRTGASPSGQAWPHLAAETQSDCSFDHDTTAAPRGRGPTIGCRLNATATEAGSSPPTAIA